MSLSLRFDNDILRIIDRFKNIYIGQCICIRNLVLPKIHIGRDLAFTFYLTTIVLWVDLHACPQFRCIKLCYLFVIILFGGKNGMC